MRLEPFSEAWAKALAHELNDSEAYLAAAKTWQWPLVLSLEQDGADAIEGDRSIYLDLWRGSCRAARPATAADLESADYVITGAYDEWLRILNDESEPMLALMRGKLKLEKGSLIALARYAEAASELLAAARRIDAEVPRVESEPSPSASMNQPNPFHTEFASTSVRGLRQDIFPMRLYHKAKRLGIWNPQDIDFSQDKSDWQRLNEIEQEVILHLTSLFLAGEESVTLDLLPLMLTVAKEGRVEEEMYLTTFLWEEAKHTEFFRRFLDEVVELRSDLGRFHGPNYRRLFYQELPTAMNALLHKPSPANQLRASVTYNMIVEGTLAETGYHGYFSMLERNGILPGLQQGIAYLKRDESRHIAYGIFLLSRLMAAQPDLWAVLAKRMEELLQVALAAINEIFDCYEDMPFGLKLDDFVHYAMGQFKSRLSRLEQAQHKSLAELYQSEITD